MADVQDLAKEGLVTRMTNNLRWIADNFNITFSNEFNHYNTPHTKDE